MPAINPRLTITLKPSTAACLRSLSELTGDSQSALIASLLEANEQTLTRLVTVLTAANQAKEAINDELAQSLGKAQAKIERQLGLALDSFDVATKPLLEEAERVSRRRAKSPGRLARPGSSNGSPTPMSNRGVRSTPKSPKNPSGTRS